MRPACTTFGDYAATSSKAASATYLRLFDDPGSLIPGGGALSGDDIDGDDDLALDCSYWLSCAASVGLFGGTMRLRDDVSEGRSAAYVPAISALAAALLAMATIGVTGKSPEGGRSM